MKNDQLVPGELVRLKSNLRVPFWRAHQPTSDGRSFLMEGRADFSDEFIVDLDALLFTVIYVLLEGEKKQPNHHYDTVLILIPGHGLWWTWHKDLVRHS